MDWKPFLVDFVVLLVAYVVPTGAAAVEARVPWYHEKLGSSSFNCREVFFMLHREANVLKSLDLHVSAIRSQQVITPEIKLKMDVLQMYEREIQATEKSLATVLKDLNESLSSNDYRSLGNIKQNCQLRLKDMRDAAIFVEEDYNSILDLERDMQSLHPNLSLKTHYHLINDILTDISHAADVLESKLQENIFQDSKNLEGADFETVIKLKQNSLFEHHLLHVQDTLRLQRKVDSPSQEAGNEMMILVDSLSNQYILSHPRDITVPTVDHHLLHDIVNLLLLSFVFGLICSLLNIPSLFGYIFSGMLLGPVGYNVIASVVQVETIGEFGVIFIVFMVGLEFSPDKLKKVWSVSVYGANLLLLVCITLAVLLGLALSAQPRHSLVVAACLSLSSSPLATRLIQNVKLDLSSSLAGILVMQDLQLGTLVALMPFFSEHSARGVWVWKWSVQLLQVVLGFVLLLVAVRGLSTRVLERFYRVITSVFNRTEHLLLGSVAICFVLLVLAEFSGASLELGCFLAGVAISSQGSTIVEQVRKLVEPVRDLFSVFFYASLGFHVFPTFLRSEFTTICVVTLCVIMLKFLLSVSVLGMFLGHCRSTTLMLAWSLAQVSEFSFVLASRARRMDIISREVYLVILSIAAMSLLLSPLLWQVYLLKVRLRRSSSILNQA